MEKIEEFLFGIVLALILFILFYSISRLVGFEPNVIQAFLIGIGCGIGGNIIVLLIECLIWKE